MKYDNSIDKNKVGRNNIIKKRTVKKRLAKAALILSILALGLAGCGEKDKNSENNANNSETEVEKNSELENSSETSKDSDNKDKKAIGKIEVKNGQVLERDIIPQLAKAYGITDEEVKSAFSKAESELINPSLDGWRKMEGIILPGERNLTESDLEEQIKIFIEEAEERYKKIEAEVDQNNKNSLTPNERIVLASMVEAECLAGEKRQETADVFLNRLSENSKLQSCVTAEYALGYQRPYLTFDDIEVDSEYNTYEKSGLPIGPISSFSDESLKYAIGKSTNPDLIYFFYDYVTGEMSFYSDYEKFDSEGKITMDRFDKESKEGKFDKINKQELYGK